jgi:hypothetical protein
MINQLKIIISDTKEKKTNITNIKKTKIEKNIPDHDSNNDNDTVKMMLKNEINNNITFDILSFNFFHKYDSYSHSYIEQPLIFQ